MGEAGRPGDKPTGRTVRNIDCHDVASVRTSPYRRRVIGPGVVPASLVDDLGGSPKCIRACRLDLRGSYRVFTLCKELGTAAAAREAYVEYMILQVHFEFDTPKLHEPERRSAPLALRVLETPLVQMSRLGERCPGIQPARRHSDATRPALLQDAIQK